VRGTPVIRRALGVLLGLTFAMAGVELWLGWWIDRMPGPGVAPTLGTLRGATTMDGLWDEALRFDPVLGWTLAPGHHSGDAGDFVQPATIGPRGNRLTGADDRPGAAHRVAVFGDSFAYGFGVRDDETFAASLAASLGEGWQVTNHGVPGYGDDQVAWAMDRWLPALDADVVVVGHAGADAWRNGLSWSYSAKPRSWLEDGAWRWGEGPTAGRDAVRTRWLARPLLRHLPALLGEALTYGGDPAQRALSEAIVHAQLDRIEASGATPVLVDVTVGAGPPFDDEVVARVCGARAVTCVDAQEALDAVTLRGEPILVHSHYSAATNAALGTQLATVVRELVP